MYLIKQPVKKVSGLELTEDDVISYNKKWFIVREELELQDKLKVSGLRDGKKYVIPALGGFGKVKEFKIIGRVLEDKWVEDLDKDERLKTLLEEKIKETKKSKSLTIH